MIIRLRGFSPDREMQVLESLLNEHHLMSIEGQFVKEGFLTVEEDIPEKDQEIISNYFAPGLPVIHKSEIQELRDKQELTNKMVDTLLMGGMM